MHRVYIIDGQRYMLRTAMVRTADGSREQLLLRPVNRDNVEVAYRPVPTSGHTGPHLGRCMAIVRALIGSDGHTGSVLSPQDACLAVAMMVALADPRVKWMDLAQILYTQLCTR